MCLLLRFDATRSRGHSVISSGSITGLSLKASMSELDRVYKRRRKPFSEPFSFTDEDSDHCKWISNIGVPCVVLVAGRLKADPSTSGKINLLYRII